MDNNPVASTSEDIDSEIQQLESVLKELKTKKLKLEQLAALRKEKSELQASTEGLDRRVLETPALETNVQLSSQAANNNTLTQSMTGNSTPSAMEYLNKKLVKREDIGWVATREEIKDDLKNLGTATASLAEKLFKFK